MLAALYRAATALGLTSRSPKWPAARRRHLLAHPTCAACGTAERVEVHHVEPFHLFPERELDPANFLTLCEGETHHHLQIGHTGNWSHFNRYAREDAAAMLARAVAASWTAALLCTALAALPPARPPAGPAAAVVAALADCKRLDPDAAAHTRYLSGYHLPAADRADHVRWLTFWLWSLAKEAEPGRPRAVAPDLWAVDLRDFGVDPFVYGRLADADPYFHVSTTADGAREQDKGVYAPWLPPRETAEMARLTSTAAGGASFTAVLRLDWFVVQTSAQDGRGKPGEGTGYYDFLGVTDRASFQKLAGLDPKQSAAAKAEHQAVIKNSGVSRKPRQVTRFGAVGGNYWFTRDALDAAKGPRNALEQLDADFKHQAEEHYAASPCGLYYFFLCDDKGVVQDSAPDKIGPDTTRPARGRDTRIEVGVSCVRCHVEGLRPLPRWEEEAFRGGVELSADQQKKARLRQLYFRDTNAELRVDNARYANALRRCNGLAPAENAKLFAKLWDRYVVDGLTLDDCARELGCTPERLRAALLAVAAQKKLAPVFADLIATPPRPMLRESWEQAYPAAMLYLGGSP